MSVDNLMDYREFSNTDEAERWAWEHYSDLLNLAPESEQYKLIFSYTGSWYKELNQLMRECPEIGSDAFDEVDFGDHAEEKAEIVALTSILQNYSLPEPIVVHRFAHLSDIVKMSGVRVLHKGVHFSDKAFVSTTLIEKQLVSFREENGCSCVLKIYLPKGLHGAYVSFKTNKTLLNEQEFLLPPNVPMKIIKIHYFTWPIQIDCVALSNERGLSD